MSNKETIKNDTEIIEEVLEEEVEEEVIERPYELQRLKDKHLWPILSIITTVFPDDLADVLVQITTKEKTMTEIGIATVAKLVVAILKNIHKVHDDLYEILSDVSGMSVEEIEGSAFGTTPLMIWDIVHNEKNASFFKVVSKLR